MNYAVVLNKNNSKDIFTHINIGERFFISYLYQDIKVGDYLFYVHIIHLIKQTSY